MKVLVDFDNIPGTIRQQGLEYLADRLFSAIGQVEPDCKLLQIRLYAGWDEKGALSKRAQDLSAEMRRHFPKIMKLTTVDPVRSIGLHVELAQSLEILPKKLLQNTSRVETFNKQMRCERPTQVACRSARCPIDAIADFFNNGECPEPDCHTTPRALLSYREQKLVDTVIVADMIHRISLGDSVIAIVSSDDDMWAGILPALRAGAHVIHVQTAGTKTILPYLDKSCGKYSQLGL